MAYGVSKEVLLLAGYISLVGEGARLETTLAQVDRMAPERGGAWLGVRVGVRVGVGVGVGVRVGSNPNPNPNRVAPERGWCLS